MADTDYLNGLKVVPLSAKSAQQWTRSAIASPPEHPWRNLYKKREEPPAKSSAPPDTNWTPPYYYRKRVNEPRLKYKDAVRNTKINGRWITKRCGPVKPFIHETIRLCDVQAFRNSTAKKVSQADTNNNAVAALTAGIARLSTSSSIRPVIYRYIDVIKDSFALLEAIHFELFMPDRPDLRFLGISLAAVPSGSVEGDYFRVPGADLLPISSFGVKLGKDVFPVVWEAKDFARMEFSQSELNEREGGLAYIVKKRADMTGIEVAVGAYSDAEVLIRSSLFPDEESRKEHSIVHVTWRDMGTAQIYAVEPPKPGPNPPKKKNEKEKEKERAAKGTVDGKKGKKKDKKKKGKKGKNAKEEEEEEAEFDPRSEYLKLVWDVRTSSRRSGVIVSATRALSATEAERIEDRLGAYTGYGEAGDVELMDELFRLGARIRAAQASRDAVDAKDAGEMRIDESIILRTMTRKDLPGIDHCWPVFDCIYGRRGDEPQADADPLEKRLMLGGLRLNAAQSRAVRLYADASGPRVFCIRSPPGSGKTTVAAAMAATVAHIRYKDGDLDYASLVCRDDGLQLLLSVQNVAVDNIGAALKKMNYGGGEVYNMKTEGKLDPENPAPFDYFDVMEERKRNEWIDGTADLVRRVCLNPEESGEDRKYEDRELSVEECLTFDRRAFEKEAHPKIILSTVEMLLKKAFSKGGICQYFRQASRIIIDEASLLTESALYCIIRNFPKARIVLIGDDKQLPPFMYDEKILGQEFAGRPALSVAMKTGKVPVVELNEVYRAPPSLVAPYNRLAYGGRLVSKKAERHCPLSKIGLIHSGLPQLLLIDVDGQQERNERTMSLSNEKEVKALQRLLVKFPDGWKDGIMIICLYKDQKRRLESDLGKNYTILTVDSAQGKEKPLVILMTTRTQIPRQGSFFDSTERCNVSVSRQQMALIILGKASLLTTNAPWSTVVNGEDFTRIKADEIV